VIARSPPNMRTTPRTRNQAHLDWTESTMYELSSILNHRVINSRDSDRDVSDPSSIALSLFRCCLE
jgi:hypothetical protein